MFPLLTKILDAIKDLSVHVHPNDEYAIEYEDDLGKISKDLSWIRYRWYNLRVIKDYEKFDESSYVSCNRISDEIIDVVKNIYTKVL